jgi:hypothetical protein
MGKGLTAFLIILFIVLAAGGVIGTDVYLSIKDFEEKSGELDLGTINYAVGTDNKTITISTTVTTPKLGYLPKAIKLDIVFKKSGSPYGDPVSQTIKIGQTQPIEFVLVLTDTDKTTVDTGGTITISVEGTVTLIYIGIPIKAASYDLPSETIDIHN